MARLGLGESESRLSVAFEPENELERAMLLAASQEAARPAFYRLLLDSELVVLGEVGKTLALDTVANQGRQYHAVFTSPRRLGEFLPEERPHFTMRCRTLFEATRGAAFVINPGCELNKAMMPDEIIWCLEQRRVPSGEFVVVRPKVYPKKLVKALGILFTSRSQIKAAHLAYIAREGADAEAHPLIGLVTEAEIPRLVEEISMAAAEAMPGERIDVVFLRPDGPLDALRQRLLDVPPFYKRTFSLN